MKNLVDAIIKRLINLTMKLSIWLTIGVAVKKVNWKEPSAGTISQTRARRNSV